MTEERTQADSKGAGERAQATCSYAQPPPLVVKLRDVVKGIVQQKGSMVLFALCRPDDDVLTWDVVVSAQWLHAGRRAGLDYVNDRISRALTPDEMVSLTRIVILQPEAPFVTAITANILAPAGSSAYVAKCVFNGMPVEEMWLLCAQRPDAPKGHTGRKSRKAAAHR